MKNDDADILFKGLRSIALQVPFECPEFIEFVKAHNPGKTFHHVCASTFGLKSTDLIGVAVEGSEHFERQKEREWLISKMPEGILNLLRFTELIVKENRELKSIIKNNNKE